MKTLLCGALTCALVLTSLSAQTSNEPDPTQVAADFQQMLDASKYREELTQSILDGDVNAVAALGKMKARQNSSGLRVDVDTDLALAALDMGRRLVAANHPAEAETFFQEAEKALSKAIPNTPDGETDKKSDLLAERAALRINYLNDVKGGRADIDAAVNLLPENARLKAVRDQLGSGKGAEFPEKPLPPKSKGEGK